MGVPEKVKLSGATGARHRLLSFEAKALRTRMSATTSISVTPSTYPSGDGHLFGVRLT
jgi:hypothetical protein